MDWQTPGGVGGLSGLKSTEVYSMGWVGHGRMGMESISGELGAWRALEHQNAHKERVLTLFLHTYWWVRAGVQRHHHHKQYSQLDPRYIKTTTQQ